MRMIYDFSDRAEECLKLAQCATSPHDRELFMDLARAWYGMADEDEPSPAPPAVKRTH